MLPVRLSFVGRAQLATCTSRLSAPLAQPKPLLPPPEQPPTRRNRPIEIPKPTTPPQSLVEPIFVRRIQGHASIACLFQDESYKELQYEVLDISLRMYDYAQLERWQRRVDQLCRQHGVRVHDRYVR
jgi:hypothetical protein